MRRLLLNRRVLLAVITCALLVILLHAAMLQIVAYPLVRSGHVKETQYVLFLRSARGSDPAFPFVADYVQAHPQRRVLVVRDYVRRAESIGAAPSFLAVTIDMLVERGVPRERIQVIGDGQVMTSTEVLKCAADWLANQDPAAEMLVLTHRFNVGYLTDVSKAAVAGSCAGRMHVLGFARHGVSETTWWHNVVGVKDFLREYLRLIHLWIFGERRPNIDWDPDTYEQLLRNRMRNG